MKKCDQLRKSRDEVEKYLFHGSSYDTLNIIIQNGFDRSYSTVAAYGKGTYFARDADYSSNPRYSHHIMMDINICYYVKLLQVIQQMVIHQLIKYH